MAKTLGRFRGGKIFSRWSERLTLSDLNSIQVICFKAMK
jgi:hypothetical protein